MCHFQGLGTVNTKPCQHHRSLSVTTRAYMRSVHCTCCCWSSICCRMCGAKSSKMYTSLFWSTSDLGIQNKARWNFISISERMAGLPIKVVNHKHAFHCAWPSGRSSRGCMIADSCQPSPIPRIPRVPRYDTLPIFCTSGSISGCD